MLFFVIIGGALGLFGLNAALTLISDRRKSRLNVVGGIKVARAVARLEAGEREKAAGQLSEAPPVAGDVSLEATPVQLDGSERAVQGRASRPPDIENHRE